MATTTPRITTADGIIISAPALFVSETRAVVRDDSDVSRGYALCIRDGEGEAWGYLCRFPTLESATVPGAGIDEANAAWQVAS